MLFAAISSARESTSRATAKSNASRVTPSSVRFSFPRRICSFLSTVWDRPSTSVVVSSPGKRGSIAETSSFPSSTFTMIR